jgi:hypothetical protein
VDTVTPDFRRRNLDSAARCTPAFSASAAELPWATIAERSWSLTRCDFATVLPHLVPRMERGAAITPVDAELQPRLAAARHLVFTAQNPGERLRVDLVVKPALAAQSPIGVRFNRCDAMRSPPRPGSPSFPAAGVRRERPRRHWGTKLELEHKRHVDDAQALVLPHENGRAPP